MNTILYLLQFVSVLAWLIVIFTAAGVLLDFNTVRCTMRGNATWMAIFAVALGAGYELTQVSLLVSAWQALLPVGVATGCVIRAPGPWWAWLKSGVTYQRRSVDRRVSR